MYGQLARKKIESSEVKSFVRRKIQLPFLTFQSGSVSFPRLCSVSRSLNSKNQQFL